MLKVEATVTKLEKIPAFGKDFDGIRIQADVDDLGYISIPIPLGSKPPAVGDALRVEAEWGPGFVGTDEVPYARRVPDNEDAD